MVINHYFYSMNKIDTEKTSALISEALKISMSYVAYRKLVSKLVVSNSTTGNEQTEALINYTLLNDRRMRRWDKTVKISESDKTAIQKFDKKVIWLVLTESWCGDAAHVVPVINKVAELNSNIEYKIVLRDTNDELMNAFLTNGNQSIPKLIMIDKLTGEVLDTYGPRPSIATAMVNVYKSEHGKLTPEFKEDLQRWYNKDKGQTTVKDLLELLK